MTPPAFPFSHKPRPGYPDDLDTARGITIGMRSVLLLLAVPVWALIWWVI